MEFFAFPVLHHIYIYKHRIEVERPEGTRRSYRSSPALKLDKHTYAISGICLTCSSKPLTTKMQQLPWLACSTIFTKYSFRGKTSKQTPATKQGNHHNLKLSSWKLILLPNTERVIYHKHFMLMLDILKKYHHTCPPLNEFSFSKESPIASPHP